MSESWTNSLLVGLPLAARLTAFLFSSAGFAICGTAWKLRLIAALVVSAMLAISLGPELHAANSSATWTAGLWLREIVLGLSLGLSTTLVMEAFRMAGSMLLAGLAVDQSLAWDARPGTACSHLVVGLGWVMLFLSGSHCVVVDHAVLWCRMYPPAATTAPATEDALRLAVDTVAVTFRLAWGIAMPLVLAQWIVQLVLAAVARVAPIWVQWASYSPLPLMAVWVTLCVAGTYWATAGWEPAAAELIRPITTLLGVEDAPPIDSNLQSREYLHGG